MPASLQEQINEMLKIQEIILSGKRAKTKEEQDKVVQILSSLSKDYSNTEYPKMSSSEFLSGNAKKAALSPQEILKSYYGENLPKEVIAAGNYNIARPTIQPQSYSRIFDTIPARKNTEYADRYHFSNEGRPLADLASGQALKFIKKLDKNYRDVLKGSNKDYKKEAKNYFKRNSLDPSTPPSNKQDMLEHEVTHHISLAEGKLPYIARDYGFVASDGFSKFGAHTGQPHETTQALGRFQREMFKNTGKRLHPVEFMAIVNKGEIPDFLTQEGRRILIYAKNLKDVADKSEDKDKKEAAKKALEAISRMAPAVVKSENKYGLNLPIG